MTNSLSCSVSVQTYKSHERSREAIEMAFDSILQEKMKVRHKQGFRPPRRGRKTDLEGDAPVICTTCLDTCETSSGTVPGKHYLPHVPGGPQ